ncbi:MAG: SDR family oxidoreductase [Proteobacteria bacterium]|nr:SDR family oxidoreductase [Pseudomonadota bacterium]
MAARKAPRRVVPRCAVPRSVVVTGGSGGIGREIVARFLADGSRVVNLDRLPPPGRRHPRTRFVAVDLLDVPAIRAAFAEADEFFEGRAPDVLVCAAAIGQTHHLLEVQPDEVDRVMGVNVRGTLFCAQEAALRMRGAGAGRIVVVTSVAAYQAWAQEPLYNVSKGAQHALVQTLAVELAPFNVQVNAVAPGVVAAQSQGMSGNRARPEILRHYHERIPAGRFCTPAEVAEAIWTLSHATYMTGQALTLDGGLMANGLAYIGTLKDEVLARLDRTLPAPPAPLTAPGRRGGGRPGKRR